MGFICFVATVVLAILLSQKSSQAKRTVDPMSASYRQGYWDGVRAAEQGAAHSPETASIAVLPVTPEPAETFAAADESGNSTPVDELDSAAPSRTQRLILRCMLPSCCLYLVLFCWRKHLHLHRGCVWCLCGC